MVCVRSLAARGSRCGRTAHVPPQRQRTLHPHNRARRKRGPAQARGPRARAAHARLADGDGGDWSVLTDANRDRALGWYPLRDVPTR